jgi:hypothetical protein
VTTILCPVCGWECVHPVALKAEPVSGDTIVYITSEGIRTIPSTAAQHIRGIRLTTTFLCEEGHQWDEERAFHKGTTFQKIHRGPDSVWENFEHPEMWPQTIWRD